MSINTSEKPILEEEDVDANLTSYLEKPIETQKRTFTEAFEEDVDSKSDNEDEEIAATHATKEEIYRVWTSVCAEKSEELLPLVEKVSKLSEAQAKAYLTCLKAVNSQSIHKHLSLRLLVFLAGHLCHPEDSITPTAMEEDPFLLNGISMFVSDILGKVGRFGLPLLLSAYAGTSWYWFRKKKTPRVPVGASPSTISNDGMRSIPDGENIAHDQAHDQRVV